MLSQTVNAIDLTGRNSFRFILLSNLLLEKKSCWYQVTQHWAMALKANMWNNYWTARFEIFVCLLPPSGKGQSFFLACVSRPPFQQQHREDVTHNPALCLHGALSSPLIQTQSETQTDVLSTRSSAYAETFTCHSALPSTTPLPASNGVLVESSCSSILLKSLNFCRKLSKTQWTGERKLE